MVTLFTSTEERIKSIEAGADDFISKPFDKTELLTRMKMLLKMKDLHDNLDSSKNELQFANEKLATVNGELQIRNAKISEVNSELKELNELLKQQATTDKLTGVSNRRRFDEAFNAELVRSKRFSTPLSLIMFDIDLFKTINDTYGHPVGDDILCELSALVQKYVRVHDTFARWGGEEFMLMMVNADMDHACLFAEKLRREIENHSFRTVDHLTCSFGVAQLMYNETAERLCLRVDEAMYAAKLSGRNNVKVAGTIGRRDKDSHAPGP
jgi:diguanylate cyclase (GGDEF)-like protein